MEVPPPPPGYPQEQLLNDVIRNQNMKLLVQTESCKSGNIRGTLIFAYFAQIQEARIQKPGKIFAIICMHILDT